MKKIVLILSLIAPVLQMQSMEDDGQGQEPLHKYMWDPQKYGYIPLENKEEKESSDSTKNKPASPLPPQQVPSLQELSVKSLAKTIIENPIEGQKELGLPENLSQKIAAKIIKMRDIPALWQSIVPGRVSWEEGINHSAFSPTKELFITESNNVPQIMIYKMEKNNEATVLQEIGHNRGDPGCGIAFSNLTNLFAVGLERKVNVYTLRKHDNKAVLMTMLNYEKNWSPELLAFHDTQNLFAIQWGERENQIQRKKTGKKKVSLYTVQPNNQVIPNSVDSYDQNKEGFQFDRNTTKNMLIVNKNKNTIQLYNLESMSLLDISAILLILQDPDTLDYQDMKAIEAFCNKMGIDVYTLFRKKEIDLAQRKHIVSDTKTLIYPQPILQEKKDNNDKTRTIS